MYLKKEHVEQAKRMKIKLKTESSYEKPETNSGINLKSLSILILMSEEKFSIFKLSKLLMIKLKV